MINNVMTSVIGRASELGVSLFEDTEAVELIFGASSEDVATVIRTIYRQVLGNAHVMESERLTVPESQLRNRAITVREFVRQVAQSELYRSRFFDNCPRHRSIELNFKHLLGRAPESYEEIECQSQILDRGGYQAEIDSYIDSDEYLDAFGEDIVPFYRGYKTQTGRKVVGFTHLFQLLRGGCSSDRSSFTGTRSRLQRSLISKTPSMMIALSSPPPYQPMTDANQLITKTLRLKSYSPISYVKNDLPRYLETEQSLQRQYQSFENITPFELLPSRSEEEVETAIRAVYRQVLGNAHVMESERLTVPESQFKRGEISVREFVRRVAKSELYRTRFFDNCPRYRSIELNFKHLLGRAPHDYSETFYHSQVLDREGLEAEIDSYLDSDEYQNAFGENIVPFYRGYKTQTGTKLLGFTNMFKLLPSVSTSDKAGNLGNLPRLSRSLIYNNPAGNVPVTDIQKLLDEVLKPKPQVLETPTSMELVRQKAEQDLQRKCEEQSQLIETFQQQLAELQPFASIGTSVLSKWQAFSPTTISESKLQTGFSSQPQIDGVVQMTDNYNILLRNSEEQAEAIASLQAQIADVRRFANIGEARLNKWRNRTFAN